MSTQTTEVRFSYPHGGGHVLLSGSFSAWKALPMLKIQENKSSSVWVLTLLLPIGSKHQYKFIVDGLWFYDPECSTETDSEGNINNVVIVRPDQPSKKGFSFIDEKREYKGRHPPSCVPVASYLVNDLRKDHAFVWDVTPYVKDVVLSFPAQKEVLSGDLTVSRYLARLDPELGIYGSDPLTASEIDSWMEYSLKIHSSPEEQFSEHVSDLNTHLRLRTYFCGNNVTLADVHIWLALSQSPYWSSFVSTNKSLRCRYLIRWFHYLETLEPFQRAKSQLPEKKHLSSGGGTFEDLVGAEKGKVVCRFPPEPSGYLHIGHAKAAFLNELYAKRYEGTLIIRFDDTNPKKEKDEYEHAILQDLESLGVRGKHVSHTSDFFQQILEKAECLIKVGKAFCDNLSVEEMTSLRDSFKPSPFRDTSIEANLSIWEEMKKGTELGKSYALRAKIDYQSHNGTMRDPVIYRCIDMPHHRTGATFKLYPIYNFSCPVVDSIEGVTHALRSNEYHDSEEQYYWFLENVPGLRPVIIKDFSRVNFSYTLLSKRKLQWFVDNKHVDGWDDPRFPTVQGVLRRGLRLEALKQFILDLGDSKKTVCMEISTLWARNKKIIDQIIPRYTAIRKEAVVPVHLDGPSSPEEATVLLCRHTPELGTKQITRSNVVYIEQGDAQCLKVNEEITLMDWGNIIITDIDKKEGAEGEKDIITGVTAKLHLEGDFKKTEHKFTWLPAHDPDLLPSVTLVEYDHLITVKTIPKEEKDWTKYVNPNSKKTTQAYADPNVLALDKGAQFQFERIGYFMKDTPVGQQPILFVHTPDGHASNVFLSGEDHKEKKDQTKEKKEKNEKMKKE